MAGPHVRKWADACELSNESRPDLPETFLLRLTDAVCEDLAIAQPDDGALVAHEHELVRKFIDRFTSVDAIDEGRPLSQVPGRGLYRIRVGEWRGVVWTDKKAGVVWLCRAVFLGDFPSEDLAYDAFESMGDDLLPAQEERDEAGKQRTLVHALRIVHEAMQSAHDHPNTWQSAKVDGKTIARTHVEQIKEEGIVLAQRFLIVISQSPAKTPSPEDWVALVAARAFPRYDGSYEFIGLDSLPLGSSFRPGREIAMSQEALGYSND